MCNVMVSATLFQVIAEGRKSVSTQEELLTLRDQVTSGGNALTLPLFSPPPKKNHTPVPTSLITLAPPTCSPVPHSPISLSSLALFHSFFSDQSSG
ncbi:hypothetical protein JOQ06_018270, partial [Pogonophryne albipinna]